MPFGDFSTRLGAALLIGAIVGLERQWQQMAGTPTSAPIAAGASAFVTCAFFLDV
jgi:putative Mg2+ transporter-C (MgtC) family protein